MKLILSAALLMAAPVFAGECLISRDPGTTWRYLDTAEAPAANWNAPGFDDKAWKSGPAPLGYGEPGLGTTLKFGDDPRHKPLTVWFRRSFPVKDPVTVAALSVHLVCDDGAVVYLNGAEIARWNMPAGPVGAATAAARTIDADEEGREQVVAVPPPLKLDAGENLIAVEVHQAYPSSSDLFLSLELKAWAPGEKPPRTAAPASRALASADAAYEKNPGDMETAYKWVRAHVEARTGLSEKITPRPLPKAVPAEWRYMIDGPKWPDPSPQLTKEEALADLDYLEEMIANCYSYADRRGADWRGALDSLRASIAGPIGKRSFLWRVERFMTVFGDPHSRFDWRDDSLRARLPVLFVPEGGKVLALKPDRSGFLQPDTPYVTAMGGLAIGKWIAAAQEGVPRASAQYQQRATFESLSSAGALAWQLGLGEVKDLTLILTSTDGPKTAESKVRLANRVSFRDWPDGSTRRIGEFGYLRIPEMASTKAFVASLDKAMQDFRDTHGLVIDVRGNGGGTQDAIRTLLPYFMKPDDPLKIINVAAYRLPLPLPHPNPAGFLGLNGRGLHPLGSEVWKPDERVVIENFLKSWKPEWTLPSGKFSDWHFMGVRPATNPRAYPYTSPVVVLQDAGCFSATDNFLGALKGHPGVTLVGTASGGGSGRMADYELPNARVSFTLCQMTSFATSGQTYDGHGVAPDLIVETKASDLLAGGSDSQLQEALRLLKERAL